MRLTFLLALVALFLCFPCYLMHSQKPSLPSIAPDRNETNPDIPPAARKELEKKANERRQADLKRDTEKLLQLSTELKQYVDKSNENVLSLDVVRKAEEIEKLAHSVKVKMRGEN